MFGEFREMWRQLDGLSRIALLIVLGGLAGLVLLMFAGGFFAWYFTHG